MNFRKPATSAIIYSLKLRGKADKRPTVKRCEAAFSVRHQPPFFQKYPRKNRTRPTPCIFFVLLGKLLKTAAHLLPIQCSYTSVNCSYLKSQNKEGKSMNESGKLMKELCRGCKFATESIKIARGYAKDKEIGRVLDYYDKEHESLKRKLSEKIHKIGEEEYKNPTVASVMTKLHTNVSLTINPEEAKIAELMINGCNMGIKTVSKNKNKLWAADSESLALADELIRTEQKMANDLLPYL